MIWKSLLGEVFKLVNSFLDNQAFIRTKSPRFSRTFFVVQIFGKRKRHAKTGRGTLTDVSMFFVTLTFKFIFEAFFYYASFSYICFILKHTLA
jgi:hypothetical protein